MSVIDVARQAGAHLLLVSPPRRRPPGSPDFYLPPDPLPELEPGEIIRAEPMDAYLVPGIRLRAHAWRVMYRSTGAVGEPTAVTGTVLMPLGRRRVRPLIGFAIGTHGIGDMAAPSRLLSDGHDWEAALIAMVLARGYAVAVTDYQGLGTPGDHAYMVGRALGPNVLDSMRAARALDPECLPDDGPTAIIGYSEGGFAAAWAAQLQPTYAPDMNLCGVAAGAAAADMEVAGPRLSGSFFSFFMAYGGIGYAAAYPELDLDPYLTPKAREGIEALRHSTVLQAAIKGPHFMHASDLTQPNVLEMPEWRARLAENRLGSMVPDAPVLLHHARQDQIVSFSQSQQLLEDWQKLGVDVRLYITRGGVDHISGAVAGTPVALEWLSRRIDRRSAPGTPADVAPVPVTVVGEAA
ncbi:MAG TPA: lipase family protein [Solirubrobacteraceae bacterium]|nr:lipase family protein [Solirubrobacteraceae bacterium]